jgi:hypothetical protein
MKRLAARILANGAGTGGAGLLTRSRRRRRHRTRRSGTWAWPSGARRVLRADRVVEVYDARGAAEPAARYLPIDPATVDIKYADGHFARCRVQADGSLAVTARSLAGEVQVFRVQRAGCGGARGACCQCPPRPRRPPAPPGPVPARVPAPADSPLPGRVASSGRQPARAAWWCWRTARCSAVLAEGRWTYARGLAPAARHLGPGAGPDVPALRRMANAWCSRTGPTSGGGGRTRCSGCGTVPILPAGGRADQSGGGRLDAARRTRRTGCTCTGRMDRL